jgi:uncharacterized protein YidB (DUF937 family)
MGILDDLMGSLSGAESAIHPEFPQAIEAVLSDPDIGSLEALLARLQQAGLGGIVHSWMSSETNLPIAPDQIRDALGDDRVRAMAAHAGLDEDAFLGVLIQHLPGLVDHLATSGRLLPAGASGTSNPV